MTFSVAHVRELEMGFRSRPEPEASAPGVRSLQGIWRWDFDNAAAQPERLEFDSLGQVRFPAIREMNVAPGFVCHESQGLKGRDTLTAIGAEITMSHSAGTAFHLFRPTALRESRPFRPDGVMGSKPGAAFVSRRAGRLTCPRLRCHSLSG